MTVASTSVIVESYVARVYGRDVSSRSSGSSTSSGHKVSSTKCTSAGCKHHKAAASSVTVGVAVAIPVAVVIFVLAAILVVVYRRSKKEAKEDNDPEFEGDIEYMPDVGIYPRPPMNSSLSTESSEFKEKARFYQASKNGSSHSVMNPFISQTNSRAQSVDPFQLPETIDSNALRDFARQVDGPVAGGWAIASQSRNASQHSLINAHASYQRPRLNQSASILESKTSPEPNFSRSTTNLDESLASDVVGSPVKSVAVEATKLYSSTNESGYEVEKLEMPNSKDSISESETKAVSFGGKDAVAETGEDKIYRLKHADSETGELVDEDDENVQRMKSIYQVYLDRNETIKTQIRNEVPELPAMDNLGDDLETENHESDEGNKRYPKSSIYSELPILASSASTDQLNQNEPLVQQMHQPPLPTEQQMVNENGVPHLQTEHAGHPQQTQQIYQESYQNVPIYSDYNNGQNELHYNMYQQASMHNQQYVSQNMYAHQQPMQGEYAAPIHPEQMQHQYSHPQTLEYTQELPMPAKLAHTESTHSLTAFAKSSKQPQHIRLQPAALNGMALNPINHPEMFYKQSGAQYSANSLQNGSNEAPKPYQLRQSIVMTDPKAFSVNNRYRPAGSLRNISEQSANNSMVSQGNQYQQHLNSRVSGLLNYSDVAQPPSVPSILPHSSSNDDLRKQLGSSHNYQI